VACPGKYITGSSDRSSKGSWKRMDRFEREMAQDGFIQRLIDNYIIRFRVSVLPMVGTELKII